MIVPVELSRILISELGQQQAIFLKEKNGSRMFPILIGVTEALAIDRHIKNQVLPRPMTHDLLSRVLKELGGKLERVVINDLQDGTFFALLIIHHGAKTLEIDARPSDAIALATLQGTPIFVEEAVFSKTLGDADASTREGRLKMLENRLQMLHEQIELLSERLADPQFVEQTPPEELENARAALQAMQVECDAIEAVLQKFLDSNE